MPQEFERSPDSEPAPQKEGAPEPQESTPEAEPIASSPDGATSVESSTQKEEGSNGVVMSESRTTPPQADAADDSAAIPPESDAPSPTHAETTDEETPQAEAMPSTTPPEAAESTATTPAPESVAHSEDAEATVESPAAEAAGTTTASAEAEVKSASTPESPSPEATAEGAPPPEKAKPAVKAGDRIRGKIVSIGDEHTNLDCGDLGPARIATSELRDRQGNVLMRLEDKLTATVSSCEDGILLSLGKKRGVLDAARLRLALENRTPVTGTVQSLNKGGFEIRIGRVRAFCPLSQIDAGFVDHPQGYLGKSMTFRVLRWENHGRNIVVSRRSILREEAKQLAQETRKQLTEGAELEGVVKRLQPFGAFVDLGGLEGLLHVSRMSHARIDDPTKLVKAGDKVRVRVVKIEHPGTRRERIALALADLGPDPWESVPEQVHVGEVLTGSVARLVPFGAFVHLPQGVDGLVHVSELSHTRVNDPKEVVSVGQEVQVKVLHVDVEKRRISLSLRRAAEPEHGTPRKREPRREKPARGREKNPPTQSPGSVSLTYTMAEQLGSLKQKLGGRR